mgnify:FL=1
MAINLASFVIPVTCLWVTRHLLHWDSIYADNVSGNVVGALPGNAFRFWAFRRFVFPTVRVAPLSFWASLEGKHLGAEEDLSEVDP